MVDTPRSHANFILYLVHCIYLGIHPSSLPLAVPCLPSSQPSQYPSLPTLPWKGSVYKRPYPAHPQTHVAHFPSSSIHSCLAESIPLEHLTLSPSIFRSSVLIIPAPLPALSCPSTCQRGVVAVFVLIVGSSQFPIEPPQFDLT